MLENERGISKKPAFLAAYVAARGSVTRAAEAVGIERTLHYRWLNEDEEYRKAFALTRIQAGEAIQDEAVRRAVEGVDEPIVYQGRISLDEFNQPLTVRKHSDALIMKLLDGFLPDVYKRRSNVELTGKDGEAIKLQADTLAKLSDEELQALVAIAAKLKPSDEEAA